MKKRGKESEKKEEKKVKKRRKESEKKEEKKVKKRRKRRKKKRITGLLSENIHNTHH